MVKIAVVGGGIVGNNIVRHIVGHPRFNDDFQIDIFDEKENMGKGKPYYDDSRHLLLNIPSDEMKIGDDQGFVNWLREKSKAVYDYNPRQDFGEFSLDMLKKISAPHRGIRFIFEKVGDIIYNAGDSKYKIYTEAGVEKYDHVFLAMGQLGYADPYDLKGTPNYIHDPYPVKYHLKRLTGSVGIIGTGLSAIDCVRHLLLENETEQVRTFSRSGDMPSVRGETHHFEIQYFKQDEVDSYIEDDLIPLEKIIELFTKEMAAHGIDEGLFYRRASSTLDDLKYEIANTGPVGKLQYLIIAVNPLFSRVFPYFSKSDKEIFMNEIHPYINKYHSPMPLEVAKQLVEWTDSGKLIIEDGIEDVEADGSLIVKTDDERFEMDWLINATGPEKDITKEEGMLMNNMLNRMLVAPGSLGGILVDRNHRVISPRYGTLPGMYAIGHLTFDTDYMSNSANIIVENTKIMVDTFMEEDAGPGNESGV